MLTPPLNIDYWASLYPVYTDYADQYEDAMDACTVKSRARQLWDWKGLNRNGPFDPVESVIEQLDWGDCLSEDPNDEDRKAAIETVSTELQNAGVVTTKSLVTSAFLLHLAASEDNYSKEYPIYDRRVWNAYVYLWGVRDTDQQLFTQASQDTTKYANFCRGFSDTCPDGKAQKYERALFMFGRFIANLPSEESPTPIEKIDDYLETQERALASKHDEAGYILVDIEGRKR
ncbi:hypothetical protein [Haloplanus salilacus]|uniref:hypothetical protein n=1 Tax=Haloplanus salilacus TaxID=2949994 RepID=UPI0030D2F70A